MNINITFGAAKELSEILTILTKLGEKMQQIQDLIDTLNAEVAENSSATQSALAQMNVLIAKVQEMLQAAAEAPSLEETNALIAAAQQAVATISANSDALVAATLANQAEAGA